MVRPGRGGKPAKVYKVDLAAIQDRGEVTSNYQLFPGDRLIVGRNEVVKKTAEIDRLNAPISFDRGIDREDSEFLASRAGYCPCSSTDEVWKELVDFWAKELSRKGDLKFDEETLREALLQKLKPVPPPGPAPQLKKQP